MSLSEKLGPGCAEGYGWHRLITEDNRNFHETPVYIDGGTGSIVKVDDTYHMFYCTFGFDKDPVLQWARHAVSKDFLHWEDIPEDKFGPDGKIYRSESDWRDPHVFWNEEEQQWWMLIAANEVAPTERLCRPVRVRGSVPLELQAAVICTQDEPGCK